MEDHDQSRCKQEYIDSILDDLRWLGFPVPDSAANLWLQTSRQQRYQEVLENLMSRNLIYACQCSRKNIQDSTGQSQGELRYPGTCANLGIAADTPGTSLRVRMPDTEFRWQDLIAGPQRGHPQQECGDFVVRDRAGNWTYQFCVVIDDIDQEIDLIIRGQDLLTSTARQMALRNLISPQAAGVTFAHHSLLQNPDGAKLSKRAHSEGIKILRERGFSASETRALAIDAAQGTY
jgi:glutamyl-tRNA synthetase/glutamyl-Q tRNA(Asp) synthetase